MMNPVTATTGHSRFEERKVAKSLYIAIGVAILAGIILFLGIGMKDQYNPPIITVPESAEAPVQR